MDIVSSSPPKTDLKPPRFPEALENDEFPPPPNEGYKDHQDIMGDETQFDE
jgi:hypothetical protein